MELNLFTFLLFLFEELEFNGGGERKEMVGEQSNFLSGGKKSFFFFFLTNFLLFSITFNLFTSFFSFSFLFPT